MECARIVSSRRSAFARARSRCVGPADVRRIAAIRIRASALAGPSAYLINISRGGVVDQDALVEALRARRIAGAGLDVFTPEPLGPGHPLTTLDNVVLTPHVGAGTLDAFRTKMRFAMGNIQRVVQGDAPLERVAGT